jgi:glycosyltransferase involved in cell wall biosynthesis
MSKLAEKKASKIFKIEKASTIEQLDFGLTNGEVIFCPHLSDERIISVMKEVQKDGKKMVVDFDDDIFNISPLSPHYEECGIENVQIGTPDGKAIPLWVDGEKGFDIQRNKDHLERIKEAISMADMVTTTTDLLADRFREFNDKVEVLPNCVDTDLWQPLDIKRKNDEIRLYWSGGSSHYEDWLLLQDVLPEIMHKYKNVKLVLMGHHFKGTTKGIPEKRIEYHPWVSMAAYPYKSAILNPDIAIIPLQDNAFNRHKSAIKWTEMGALGVPSVVSYVSPYKEVDNGENAVFIEANDPEGWIAGISMLIEDSILRNKIGGEARQTVFSKFDINKRCYDWVRAYRSIR